MDFAEDQDHRLIREAVREVCARFPDEYWAGLDESHTFPWEFYAAMASPPAPSAAHARLGAAELAIRHASWRIDHGLPAGEQANLAKFLAAEAGFAAADAAVQTHGGSVTQPSTTSSGTGARPGCSRSPPSRRR